MNIAFAISLFVVTALLKIPPLLISVGMGPAIFRFPLGATSIRICSIPLSAYATYQEDDEIARRLPSAFERLILAALSFVPILALSWILSGAMPLKSLANSFSQLASLMLPWGDSGPLLVHQFDLLLDQNTKVATAVLASKAGLWSLAASLTTPFLWLGVRDPDKHKGPALIGMLMVLAWLLVCIFAFINIVRYLL